MKLSCVDALVPGSDRIEKARKLRAWGYDGIAVYGDCRTWTDEDTRQLQRLPGECGIDVAEFCLVGDWYGHLLEEGEPEERSVETVCRAVQIASSLGAVTEVEFDAPRVSEISFNHRAYPLPPKRLRDRFVRNMREICAFAEAKGAKVLLEACNRYEREYNNLQAHSLI